MALTHSVCVCPHCAEGNAVLRPDAAGPSRRTDLELIRLQHVSGVVVEALGFSSMWQLWFNVNSGRWFDCRRLHIKAPACCKVTASLSVSSSRRGPDSCVWFSLCLGTFIAAINHSVQRVSAKCSSGEQLVCRNAASFVSASAVISRILLDSS